MAVADMGEKKASQNNVEVIVPSAQSGPHMMTGVPDGDIAPPGKEAVPSQAPCPALPGGSREMASSTRNQ